MDVVRWGVLSTASIGIRRVIPALAAADGCVVTAIASRDRARAEAVGSSLGIERAYGSYEALLADPDVDVVYNPLPNHLHGEWTLRAAEAGKHVLCEKPLAMDAREARDMVDGCASAGVRLMEAFMYRLHPQWAAVRDIVASGRLGEVTAVQTFYSYRNVDPDNIRNVAAYGGGALMDIGCYAINASRMLFEAEPDRVEALVSRDSSFGTDVVTSAVLGFGDRQAGFTVSTRVEPDQRVHVSGTEGRLLVEVPFNAPPDRSPRILVTAGGDPPAAPRTEVIVIPRADQFRIQAERFARAVAEGTEMPIPPEDSVANMRVIDAVFEAASRA